MITNDVGRVFINIHDVMNMKWGEEYYLQIEIMKCVKVDIGKIYGQMDGRMDGWMDE